MTTNTQASAGARFRQAPVEESPLQIVDTINANSALLAKRAGYRANYLSGGGVAMIPHSLSAFRATNKAAENVYAAIRRDGTQKSVVDSMQMGMELYDSIGYHDYEAKLDALFAQNRG